MSIYNDPEAQSHYWDMEVSSGKTQNTSEV